jgi:hypothetical protein
MIPVHLQSHYLLLLSENTTDIYSDNIYQIFDELVWQLK